MDARVHRTEMSHAHKGLSVADFMQDPSRPKSTEPEIGTCTRRMEAADNQALMDIT